MMKKNNKKGFALLFAVLTAGLMLTIGVSIFNISLKELLISGASRDSQMAFYAADSARECAMYWDLKKGAFKTCVDESCNTADDVEDGLEKIKCAGTEINVPLNTVGPVSESNTKVFTFSTTTAIKFGGDDMPDATLMVKKSYSVPGKYIFTTISSQGHNTGPDNRRVERGIVQAFDPSK